MSSCEGDCSCLKRKRLNTPQANDSDEDIWLEDGDEEHFKPADIDNDEIFGDDIDAPEHIDTLALRRAHAKQGFIKGIAEAKLRSTQKGFDDGYRNGSDIGLRVGEIISTLNYLKTSKTELVLIEATEMLEILRKDLYIANVLNHRYFNGNIDLGDKGHELLIKWEHIVDGLMSKTF